VKKIITIIFVLFFAKGLQAQKENAEINRGNEAYKQKQYEEAAESYRKALGQSPRNTTASFNLGNALFRDKKAEEAEKYFGETIKNSENNKMEGDSWYNIGVNFTTQRKLLESIEAYKNALRLNPTDTLARENLQRALNELKQQQEQNKNQQQKQQNKLTKQQLQQMLQALQEQEKNLQQKMNKSKVPSPGQPDKDW
jgi:Ca-activated chloride channel family protein